MLDQFWEFLKILPPGQPRIYQNQLLISSLYEKDLTESLAGLLISLCEHNCRKLPKSTYFGRF